MPAQKLRRSSDLSRNLINDIIAARPRSGVLRSRSKIDQFLAQYFANVPVDDMAGRPPRIMGLAAVSHLEFAKTRKPGEVRLRIFNPTEKQDGYDSKYTIIEMVNDNMPFLVDSVSAAIAHQDLAVNMTIHPVLRVRRDARGRLLEVLERNATDGIAESYVRFSVDREPDLHHLKVLEQEILKVLADVRSAVRDWRAMRARMLDASESLGKTKQGADPELLQESEALLRWMADDPPMIGISRLSRT